MSESTNENLPNKENDHQDQPTRDARPHYSPRANNQAGPDEEEAIIGQSDLPQRAAGHAGQQAGSGVPGLGGAAGGTSNYGGVGLPGGAQQLGGGSAPTDDARLGGSAASGGLGTGGQPASGMGNVGQTEVLPNGATRRAGTASSDGDAATSDAARHEHAVRHADQGSLEPGRGAMMTNEPGAASANDISTHGDEAVTLDRSARGNLGPEARPIPIPPPPHAPSGGASGTEGGPALGGSLAENPETDLTQTQQ